MAKLWANQISNRNFLSPVGFKFAISKIPKADFFANQANIPGIDLGYAEQPTYLKIFQFLVIRYLTVILI